MGKVLTEFIDCDGRQPLQRLHLQECVHVGNQCTFAELEIAYERVLMFTNRIRLDAADEDEDWARWQIPGGIRAGKGRGVRCAHLRLSPGKLTAQQQALRGGEQRIVFAMVEQACH